MTDHNSRERFTFRLFERLWEQYRERVSYVQVYERVVREAGATFVNDHIAFRTFALQEPTAGIVSLSRVFEALDYRPAGVYHFPDKHLNAIHYQHHRADFPKLFISELKTWELDEAARSMIQDALATHRAPFSTEVLARLAALDSATDREDLLDEVAKFFQQRPWEVPQRQVVETVSAASQYAAWVLVHGYNVNHFTALVNSHGVDALEDLDKTAEALRAAGVPMKAEIEGEPGSKLRQTATEAVVIDVTVRDGDQLATMPWTYAYFELAERNTVTDPNTGQAVRFEGFLGPQATNLFEMTRIQS